jgi:hypothetical protein
MDPLEVCLPQDRQKQGCIRVWKRWLGSADDGPQRGASTLEGAGINPREKTLLRIMLDMLSAAADVAIQYNWRRRVLNARHLAALIGCVPTESLRCRHTWVVVVVVVALLCRRSISSLQAVLQFRLRRLNF